VPTTACRHEQPGRRTSAARDKGEAAERQPGQPVARPLPERPPPCTPGAGDAAPEDEVNRPVVAVEPGRSESDQGAGASWFVRVSLPPHGSRSGGRPPRRGARLRTPMTPASDRAPMLPRRRPSSRVKEISKGAGRRSWRRSAGICPSGARAMLIGERLVEPHRRRRGRSGEDPAGDDGHAKPAAPSAARRGAPRGRVPAATVCGRCSAGWLRGPPQWRPRTPATAAPEVHPRHGNSRAGKLLVPSHRSSLGPWLPQPSSRCADVAAP